MTLETETEANPFDAFNSASQLYGFVFKRFGQDFLRQLLAQPYPTPLWREQLEEDAAELASMGVLAASKIIAEAAAKAPSEEPEACPHDPNRANGRAWMQSYRNRQRERQRKRERLGLTVPDRCHS